MNEQWCCFTMIWLIAALLWYYTRKLSNICSGDFFISSADISSSCKYWIHCCSSSISICLMYTMIAVSNGILVSHNINSCWISLTVLVLGLIRYLTLNLYCTLASFLLSWISGYNHIFMLAYGCGVVSFQVNLVPAWAKTLALKCPYSLYCQS